MIRLRVETDQFILSCVEIGTFLLWLESLCAAIDLAPSIDERKIPVDQSMPRIRRRRVRPGATDMESNDGLVRQQQEIMRVQYPRLADDSIVDEPVQRLQTRPRTPNPSRSSPPSRARPDTAPQTPNPHDIHPGTRVPTTQLTSRRSSTSSQTSTSIITLRRFLMTKPESSEQNRPGTSLGGQGPVRQGPTRPTMTYIGSRISTSSVPNPNVSPETGKWQPVHQTSSTLHDLLYAKRCMALLLRNSPRKTNLVICRGSRWIIDWATGALTRFEPPSYGDVELVGPWGFSPGGVIARI